MTPPQGEVTRVDGPVGWAACGRAVLLHAASLATIAIPTHRLPPSSQQQMLGAPGAPGFAAVRAMCGLLRAVVGGWRQRRVAVVHTLGVWGGLRVWR